MSALSNQRSADDCTSIGVSEVAGLSDIGKKREVNQDHYLIADLHRMLTVRGSNVPHSECEQLTGSDPGLLLVVADGMGGHADGEVASSTAIEFSARYVLDMMHWFLKLSDGNEDDFVDELSNCLKSIQRTIWSKNGGNGVKHQMGTTVTMAYVVGHRMYVVHAGDSRCYLMRDGELKQLTTDHTLAQRLVDDGALSAEAAESSRWRHILWNCVGGGDHTVQPEVTKVLLRETDIVLLCSDGLTGMVSDAEIADVLATTGSTEAATKKLVQLANDAGGTDNITVVIGKDLFPQGADCEDGELADTDEFLAV